MKRAIIAVGKQDTDLGGMIPVDPQIEIMGGSSDHTILDLTHADKDYQVGDIVSFTVEYGAIIPKQDNLGGLVAIARKIEEKFGIKLSMISGGNSSSIYLIWKEGLPEGINNLRLGESFLLGNDTAYGDTVPGCVHDTLTLEAQIVELKEKPSLPIGEVGVDAFGEKPYYEDRGIMKRAIIAVGKQDTDLGGMIPVDSQIEIMGGSSDHTILDLTHADKDYQVGDIVSFTVEYGAMLKLATSPYVEKVYVK